ncbi:MAG: hypothetical protein KC731_04880, partial [Myxococcales bacterium]|nr:hypothetical protein [Myxococcales bacterium]
TGTGTGTGMASGGSGGEGGAASTCDMCPDEGCTTCDDASPSCEPRPVGTACEGGVGVCDGAHGCAVGEVLGARMFGSAADDESQKMAITSRGVGLLSGRLPAEVMLDGVSVSPNPFYFDSAFVMGGEAGSATWGFPLSLADPDPTTNSSLRGQRVTAVAAVPDDGVTAPGFVVGGSRQLWVGLPAGGTSLAWGQPTDPPTGPMPGAVLGQKSGGLFVRAEPFVARLDEKGRAAWLWSSHSDNMPQESFLNGVTTREGRVVAAVTAARGIRLAESALPVIGTVSNERLGLVMTFSRATGDLLDYTVIDCVGIMLAGAAFDGEGSLWLAGTYKGANCNIGGLAAPTTTGVEPSKDSFFVARGALDGLGKLVASELWVDEATRGGIERIVPTSDGVVVVGHVRGSTTTQTLQLGVDGGNPITVSYSGPAGTRRPFVARYQSRGEDSGPIWASLLGGNGELWVAEPLPPYNTTTFLHDPQPPGGDVTIDPAGNVIVAATLDAGATIGLGEFAHTANGQDIVVLKFAGVSDSTEGELLWGKASAAPGDDVASAVAAMPDGRIFGLGYGDSDMLFGAAGPTHASKDIVLFELAK